jgi:hypothetical protein
MEINVPLTRVEYTLLKTDAIVSKSYLEGTITYTTVKKLKDIISPIKNTTGNINSASKEFSAWNKLPPAWNS